jgi:hypothetical protein
MERGDTSPLEAGSERDDLLRITLDTIRDVKALGVSPGASRKLDALAEALRQDRRAEALSGAPPSRKFGAFAEAFTIGPDFFEPLSDEELRAWGEA